ncbi:MAG: recombination-associated protein RdgC [Burkholderiaceae bacterium]|nr:recombination-associated protein RdgC [Burkholderiaceae bacterium]
MFKNLIIYRISGQAVTLGQLEAALLKAPFIECGATQEKSAGWVPPRGEAHGALVESINGQWIARLMTETKAVPSDALARKVKEKAERIEQETGRKLGKKETRDLKEEARLDLLPVAFTKRATTWVWIDPLARALVIDTSSQARADEVASSLVELLPPGFALALLNTKTAPQAAMAHWLNEQEPPEGFTVDRECELKSQGEDKSVVRYANHPLDIQEVLDHINAGLLPTRLALTWDGRVSFTLTQQLQVKGIRFLDSVFESQQADEGGFDADVAIATGELGKLIPDLVKALDGELVAASVEGEDA